MIKKILLVAIILLAGYAYFGDDIRAHFFAPTESDLPVALSTELQTEVYATDLEVPWGIAESRAGDLILTERAGNIFRLTAEGDKVLIRRDSDDAENVGEGGLLGLTIHPQFSDNNYIYLYETYMADEGDDQLLNRVVRYTLENDVLIDELIIIDQIPGARYHDGGRIAFGPPKSCASGQADCKLYITTGDATQPDLAQDLTSLAGKILRLNADGTIPEDNPFPSTSLGASPKTAIYSYGHRNPQGLAWDARGNLYSSEHGPSGLESGQDEINLVIAGGNYGWPYWSGTERPGPGEDSPVANPIFPIAASGPDETWAPAGLSYWRGDLWFGGLRGQSLYQLDLDSVDMLGMKEANDPQITRHFVENYGRLRTTYVDSLDRLLVTTSNRDGRGDPGKDDDQVVIVASD